MTCGPQQMEDNIHRSLLNACDSYFFLLPYTAYQVPEMFLENFRDCTIDFSRQQK